MGTEAEKIEIKYTVEIHDDNDAISPLSQDYDESPIQMVCSHSRYNLGTVQAESSQDVFAVIAEDLGIDMDTDVGSEEEYEKAIALISEKAFIEPVSLYDHSGISMSIGRASGWDSGQVGFIYVSKEKLEKEFALGDGETWETKAERIFKETVDIYDEYLRGNVYGYTVTVEGIFDDGNEVILSEDSSYGYYGSTVKGSDMLESMGDYFIGDDLAEFEKELPSYFTSDESYDLTVTHTIDELPEWLQKDVREALGNIGLKVSVDENDISHIKINGTPIDNILFEQEKTEWRVENRADYIEELENVHRELTSGEEGTVSLEAEMRYLKGFDDEFMFSSTKTNTHVLKSDSPDAFDKICDSLASLNTLELVFKANAEKRLENAKNKTETNSPSL